MGATGIDRRGPARLPASARRGTRVQGRSKKMLRIDAPRALDVREASADTIQASCSGSTAGRAHLGVPSDTACNTCILDPAVSYRIGTGEISCMRESLRARTSRTICAVCGTAIRLTGDALLRDWNAIRLIFEDMVKGLLHDTACCVIDAVRGDRSVWRLGRCLTFLRVGNGMSTTWV